MKEIKAIIQPFMLEKVLHALHDMPGLPGVTVSEVLGYGRSPGKRAESALESAKRTKLEIVVPDRLVDDVLKIILVHGHTGNRGDGKVFVIEAVDALAIRTGDRGDKAL